MEGSMSFTWMIVFLILMFIELATVNLVSIWFAIGALCSFIISYFIDILYIQIIVFIVASSISLLLTRKIVNKIKGKKEATNLDRVIGKIGVVQSVTCICPQFRQIGAFYIF